VVWDPSLVELVPEGQGAKAPSSIFWTASPWPYGPGVHGTLRQQWFTHVRLLCRTPDPLPAGLFRNAHNPGSLPAQLAVVWDLRLLGDPGGPPSITSTARFMLATFYIVTTPLSGHTADSAITSTLSRECESVHNSWSANSYGATATVPSKPHRLWGAEA